MNRHYYISDNLDELETIESELQASGINTEQIHVLSDQDAEVERHQLHDVNSLMKKDLVHSGGLGGLVGLGLAAMVLAIAYLSGWAETAVGWMPFLSTKQGTSTQQPAGRLSINPRFGTLP